MKEFPETSASLIARMKGPDDADAWKEFEKLYRPVIFRTARAKGLQYADSVDLVQQVLISIANAIGSYELHESGPPFRHWLSRIARNAILKALTRQPKDRGTGGTQFLEVLAELQSTNEDETEFLIHQELQREIFAQAARKVRQAVSPETWLAFEFTAIQNQPIESVARRIHLSVGNVYAARSRVMKKLKEAVKVIQSDFELKIYEEKNDQSSNV
ncbi:MAG: sigma-70 family RNA polymerase sigma factor [Planctomycetota bacterium]